MWFSRFPIPWSKLGSYSSRLAGTTTNVHIDKTRRLKLRHHDHKELHGAALP
jgi:hypothetical protein